LGGEEVMTYRLNVCLLSSVFERKFGLSGFAGDYYDLIIGLNNSFNFLNREKPKYMTEANESIFRNDDYRLFCKLSHFFDDFNFFINLQLSPKITQERYSKFSSVDDGFRAFIRRVKTMNIPRQIQDTIAGFLNVQRAKVPLAATRKNSWLVPNLLQSKSLHMINGKPKNILTDTRLSSERYNLLHQLAVTSRKFPELRLGQLLSNSLPEGTDIFYVTDAKLIQLLKDFEAHH
jgi:hypothetical protein